MNPSKGMEAAEAEIDRLRASLAAIKAENEALKKELPSEAFKAGCQKNMDDAKALNQELFRKNSTLSAALSRYLDW